MTFKNIPPAAEVVEFKKPEAVSTHVEKENRTALETLSVKEPSDSKKTKRNEEKKSKRISSKSSVESGVFSLQVAAFKEKEKADGLKKSISGKEKIRKQSSKNPGMDIIRCDSDRLLLKKKQKVL